MKYLGIMLDSKLLFKQHIAIICHKAVKCGRALFPFSIGNQCLIIRIKCFYKTILTYACQIFRMCGKSHLKRHQVIQNNMLKLIYNLNIHHSTEMLHADHNQKTIMEIISDFTRRCRRLYTY